MKESIFAKEKINCGRQYNLDLLKALAIVAMILCHAVNFISAGRADYESEFGYLFADRFLGSYLAVAHAFMFCMGVGFVYSKNNDPKSLFIRGIKIYILAYVLNFFRGGIYALFWSIFLPGHRDLITYTLFAQDILQFAGLAMMLTALFKKLKLDCRIILAIAFVMSVFSQLAAFKYQGNLFMNVLIGSFVPTVHDYSTFVLCGWYLFVAAGICFGEILQRVKNLRLFYRRILCVSGVVLAIYIALTVRFGCFFLSPGNIYYYASVPEAVGLLSIDFVLMSLMYLGLSSLPEGRITGSKFLRICWTMSRNINQIYFTQWCIIGFFTSVLVYVLEIPMPYWITYLMGIAIIFASYIIADKWVKRKSKRKAA